MQNYEVYCRPLGSRDLPATMMFVVEGPDHNGAWRQAAQSCFDGGVVQARDGSDLWLRPRNWTVCRVRPSVPAVEGQPDEDDGWPRPDPEFASPATREMAMSRVYAGRCYESLPIRRSRTVLAFAGNSRPVALRLV
ncbi:hypothetical protein [Rhodovibrio salinarum]|uniref:Uncharacterized protein n=1 Tax=Rhodovibrio salinarum TaxID=1087 RepID=A0A934QGV4_9PROT|nr:hypothetical protein [Rhodovibrio salinarum]MBK1696422.1 hypothetical protein [Rhodovibrio salinarum]